MIFHVLPLWLCGVLASGVECKRYAVLWGVIRLLCVFSRRVLFHLYVEVIRQPGLYESLSLRLVMSISNRQPCPGFIMPGSLCCALCQYLCLGGKGLYGSAVICPVQYTRLDDFIQRLDAKPVHSPVMLG